MCVCICARQQDRGHDAGCIPPIPFPLSSCSLDAFFLGGGGRTADPLASCPSQNRCLPLLSEERDGRTLSDISDPPMRSQALATAPMGDRRRVRFPGSPAGGTGPRAAARLRRSSCPRLLARLPVAPVVAPSACPRFSRTQGLAPPSAAQLPAAGAPAAARLMPPGSERAGGPAAAGR